MRSSLPVIASRIRRQSARSNGLVAALTLVLCAAATTTAAPIDNAGTVKSRQFHISYDVQPSPLPLQAVELWYTRDAGETWVRAGVDEDRRSPVRFDAPGEGLYGFCIILYNAVGASSPRPTAGTNPQQWVLVDDTSPVVQARSAIVSTEENGGRSVRIEWSAYDEYFSSRPIELDYRLPDERNWTVLAPAVANVGRYDGALPPTLYGDVSFRVLARDRVGHVVTSELSPVTIDPPPPPPEAPAPLGPTVPDPPAGQADNDDRVPFVSPSDAAKATKLLEYGNWFLLRGQLDVAAERFHEAIELDPTNRDALINLAGVQYRRGQSDRAIETYHRLLKYHKNDIAGLRGLALAHVAQKRYASAAENLEEILKRIGDEPRTRIELGDVLLLSGQRSAAYRHWNAVAREPGLTPDLLREVQLRLQTYSASSQ